MKTFARISRHLSSVAMTEFVALIWGVLELALFMTVMPFVLIVAAIWAAFVKVEDLVITHADVPGRDRHG